MGRLFLISACPRPVVAAALASLDTLMPLHSAVAAARLRSCIAADSACWSCLSQGEPIASSPKMLEFMLVGYVSLADFVFPYVALDS